MHKSLWLLSQAPARTDSPRPLVMAEMVVATVRGTVSARSHLSTCRIYLTLAEYVARIPSTPVARTTGSPLSLAMNMLQQSPTQSQVRDGGILVTPTAGRFQIS